MADDNSIKCRLDHSFFCISVDLIMILLMKMSEAAHIGQGLFKDTEFCKASKLTRKVVDNCPKDYAGVMEAANRKNCSAIKSTCTGRLEYHCVINPWGNVTVEVCAPATPISTDSIKKKGENSKNTSKYEAAELYEDFLFCHHRIIGLLHCLIAFGKVIIACSSVPTHSMIHVLAALLLVITRSSGECVPEAAIKVGNIRILGSCETCDSIKDYPICEGQNISACLRVFPGLNFGVGCAPNICINGSKYSQPLIR